jgi:hypothetical protein
VAPEVALYHPFLFIAPLPAGLAVLRVREEVRHPLAHRKVPPAARTRQLATDDVVRVFDINCQIQAVFLREAGGADKVGKEKAFHG